MILVVLWTDEALHRVQQIADHFAERNPAAAAAWIERLFDRVQVLTETPLIGPPWPDTSSVLVRRLVVDKHVVMYRYDEARGIITILSVWHSRQRQDLPSA